MIISAFLIIFFIKISRRRGIVNTKYAKDDYGGDGGAAVFHGRKMQYLRRTYPGGADQSRALPGGIGDPYAVVRPPDGPDGREPD